MRKDISDRFEKLKKAMDEDAKDPNGVLNTMIKEYKEKEEREVDFFKSKRMAEIVDQIKERSKKESVNKFNESSLNDIFKNKEESYLFLDSISSQINTRFSGENEYFSSTLIYLSDDIAVSLTYGQGDIYFEVEVLKNKIKEKERVVVDDDGILSGYDYVIFEDGTSKEAVFGNKDKVLKYLIRKTF